MNASWLPENRWMRRSLIAAVVLYGWTIFGILSSAHFFLGEEARGGASLEDVAGHVLVFYWAWAAVTPFVLFALRRAVHRGATLGRRWTIILIAIPAIVLVHGLVYLTAVRVASVEAMTPIGLPELSDYAMRHAGGDLATVAVLVAVYLLFDARRQAHAREVAAAALEARLAAADLEVLRTQLQPHFLFNALNTVSTLVIKGDGAGAEDAIGGISRYLRSALTQRADVTVTVADEIADVREYFAIERLRFGDALCLDVRVDERAQSARIPALILQPLVENAIRHGMSPSSGATCIGLSATIDDGRLRVCVTDSGAGSAARANGSESGEGFGLRYVRERLHHHYGDGGDGAKLTLEAAPTGSVVTIDVPLAQRMPLALA